MECGNRESPSVPSSDDEWKIYVSKIKRQLPERSLSQGPIPLAITRMIDHTLLKKDIDPAQIDTLCNEAKENDFASVCIRLEHVSRAVANLQHAPNTVVACVVGFHEGTYPTADKVKEAKEAVKLGARELDMVINWPLLKEGRYTEVFQDVLAVRQAAPKPICLKAIVEASQLEKDELIAATIISCMAGADFAKTSTGFVGNGARVEDVLTMSLICDLCGVSGCSVKASGGIRSADDSLRLVKAGARRLGTSSGVKIAREMEEGEVLEQGVGHAVT